MGKVFAILGDIHSNLEALTAVLEDCRAQGVTDYLCTGDIVGYNANPKECLDLVRGLNCPAVMGNHDYYVSTRQDLSAFNPNAAHVVEWTRKQLSMRDITYLRTLPFVKTVMGFSIVHSTCDRPESFGYVFDNLQADANFVNQKTAICFHGHTHCPVIYERSAGSSNAGVSCYDAQDFKIELGHKFFINVGSVGQPRDGDKRASYVIFHQQEKVVRFRRLEYDIESAQRKILEAGLPERLAMRLVKGQ